MKNSGKLLAIALLISAALLCLAVSYSLISGPSFTNGLLVCAFIGPVITFINSPDD
ncbi:MAG: hypothetical protein ACRBFS_10485 [Aureispira sp.]